PPGAPGASPRTSCASDGTVRGAALSSGLSQNATSEPAGRHQGTGVVGAEGFEPPSLSGPDPKSGASASSATRPKTLVTSADTIIICAAADFTERCQSGRSGSPRKRVSPQGDRGFESHPLRHFDSPCL